MKAVAYYRSSTEIQVNSIDMQQHMAFESSIYHVIPIEEEYVDKAVSARKTTTAQRAGLKKLLQDIQNDKVSTLFVFKRDRLARKAIEYLEIYELLKEKNVQVIFTAENEIPIYYTPVGELFEYIMAGMVQREGEQIIERIRARTKANFLNGKYIGTLPFGYSYNSASKKITRDEEKLSIVKTIYERFNDGHSTGEVAKTLNATDLLRDGKVWTSQSIRSILTNPLYMGLRVMNYEDETLQKRVDHLAVINEEDWEKAQHQLELTQPAKNRIPSPKVLFPLESLLFCGECHEEAKRQEQTLPLQPLVGKAKTARYICKKHNAIKLEKADIEQQMLDRCYDFFGELLSSHLQDLFVRFEKSNRTALEDQLRGIENKLSETRRHLITRTEKWFCEKDPSKKESLEQALVNGYDKFAEQKRLKERVQFCIGELEEIRNKIKQQDEHFASKENIQELDEKVVKELFSDVIHQVMVYPLYIEITFKHPFLQIKEALVSP